MASLYSLIDFAISSAVSIATLESCSIASKFFVLSTSEFILYPSTNAVRHLLMVCSTEICVLIEVSFALSAILPISSTRIFNASKSLRKDVTSARKAATSELNKSTLASKEA